MNATDFNLETYLAQGAEKILRQLTRFSEFHPAEAAFMARFALSARQAGARRQRCFEEGLHVPPFLIASITSLCNLHCSGCYARSMDTCSDGTPVDQMKDSDWERVFAQAEELGISFILLAGGEPMARMDVIHAAARHADILFPVFTNGTMLNEGRVSLFNDHRNLIPVISLEGDERATDARRGEGVFQRVQNGMSALREKRIPFGVSITVTRENAQAVTEAEFVRQLMSYGVKAIVYVEFVPTEDALEGLEFTDADRESFTARLDALRADSDMPMLIAFPGDERRSGGCLAAGRGFFHINSHGGAEPCPFSPYSDVDLKRSTLRDALQSKLFRALNEEGLLQEDHDGGCVLFRQRQRVSELLNAE